MIRCWRCSRDGPPSNKAIVTAASGRCGVVELRGGVVSLAALPLQRATREDRSAD